jgi:transcriptional regulator with XRE-family HTH domain
VAIVVHRPELLYNGTMDDREPTIRSRELGDGLRRAMEHAGLSGKATAETLGWSPTRVSRVVKGRRGIKEIDVAAFLGACGVTGKERARLLSLCKEQDKQGWWQQFGSRLPKQLVTYIDHEARATQIDHFQGMIVPGLLQTGDYASALMRESGRIPEDEIADRVATRLARTSVFSKEAGFNFFIHEFALRLPVGGPSVMSEQLHDLLRLATRPNVMIRVIPASIGGHAGTAGSFILLHFPDYRPVVYLDSETSCLFLEKPVESTAYEEIVAGLDAVALDVSDSKEAIAQLAIELYSD